MPEPAHQEPGQPAQKGNLLTAAAWNALLAEAKANRLRIGPSSGLVARRSAEGIDLAVARSVGVRIAFATSGIPARSGATLGSATVKLQNRAGTTLSDDVDVTCLNFSATAVGIHYIAVALSGDAWVAVAESC